MDILDRPFGYAMILDTAYGRMIVDRYDTIATPGLASSGKGLEHETIERMAECLPFRQDSPNVIDVGANVGVYTLGLASRLLPGGRVYAFEPQRILFNMLAGSVALNSLDNVFCCNMALGDRDGEIEIPQYDYDRPMSFGSIEFDGEQKEPLAQERGHDPARRETVPLVRLDSLGLRRVGLIKIDVEGMEEKVLAGARETIARERPFVLLETIKSDRDALRALFTRWDYAVIDAGINDFYCPNEFLKPGGMPSL